MNIFGNYLKDEIACVADGFDVVGREREGPYISALSNWMEDGTIYDNREECQPGWGWIGISSILDILHSSYTLEFQAEIT